MTEKELSDIEKLAELKAKGIITQQEFDVKKKQILDSISFSNNQNKKLEIEKNTKGCLKFFLILILVFFILIIIAVVFGGNSKNSSVNSNAETAQSSVSLNEIAKLQKELENDKLTNVQREEIEIEIKSIKTLEFAEKNISAWDRSNPKLVSAVKKTMNNPDSFEHVETTFDYKKDKVIATMIYRGNNALGSKVLGKVLGTFDYDGKLLNIGANN
ncbi:SHOCT domain-containing protein [Chryseobacterium wangxinyae]|uniref:SHOCT domain-containing protein n=1 Tax=Chryseobacterium sp. CY350 TaxID=2997336 RepID=UPI00226DDEF2|nr:SHOCT domain-containing protein [Chryseobacterium sp. CY350]MCY0976563.1 SHOCT domain-containing protein [Chryseobacterium sp. CY350]WBZ96566.1 SHOCT domain-containing protein [Chryseobacterium sp. CY350]